MPVLAIDRKPNASAVAQPPTLRVFEVRDVAVTADGMAGADWRDLGRRHPREAMYGSPGVVSALAGSLGQRGYGIEARRGSALVGALPLVHLKSRLFGSFLVSLPYVSWAGVVSDDQDVAHALVDRAVELADTLDVDFLELRQMTPLDHPALTEGATRKAQMVVPIARGAEAVWNGLKSEVRTQIRKARRNGLELSWSDAGRSETLDTFYDVVAHNMRDLGTPVFPQRLFADLIVATSGASEIGVVRLDGKAVAACLAIHGDGLTEIPTAASLRAYRGTAANSLMYWDAIERAIGRGQREFDFGRSTPDSATYVFKRKWGAVPVPVTWQYYLRRGSSERMRPESRRFDLARDVWKRMPVAMTRMIGPSIVRGIP